MDNVPTLGTARPGDGRKVTQVVDDPEASVAGRWLTPGTWRELRPQPSRTRLGEMARTLCYLP